MAGKAERKPWDDRSVRRRLGCASVRKLLAESFIPESCLPQDLGTIAGPNCSQHVR
jgi:hypothetical protein